MYAAYVPLFGFRFGGVDGKRNFYEDVGAVIGFDDIYVTLTPYGEVKESIEWRIRELEGSVRGLCSVIRFPIRWS